MKQIKNMQEWAQLLDSSKEKTVFVDFTATWCGPCRMIGPIFEKLATENPDAEFVKVDVDVADDVAAHCGIQAMPTFHAYKDGKKVGEMMGANQSGLAAMITKHK